MAPPKVSFGKLGVLKRGSSGGLYSSQQLKESIDDKTTDPKHLHPGPKTLEVKLAKKSTTAASVTVDSPGLKSPVTVSFAPGETSKFVTIDVVDLAGAYELELKNAQDCVAPAKKLKIKVPCVVALDEPPFVGGQRNVHAGDAAEVSVRFTARPSADVTVALKCDGFVKKKDTITIKAGTTSPAKHPVTLETKFGEYTMTLGKTSGCVLPDNDKKKEKALEWEIEETFKLSASITFGLIPIAGGEGDPVTIEPGSKVTLNLRMVGTSARVAEYKLVGTGLVGLPPKDSPPSPTSAGWTRTYDAETAPGKHEIEIQAIQGVEAKGKVKFVVPLYIELADKWDEDPAPGKKGKIKVKLSAAVQKDTKLTLTSKGFAKKESKFVIPAGQTELVCEVEPVTKFGGFTVELTASEPAVVRPERSLASFRLVDDSDDPEIGFPKKEPVVGKLKKKYECGEIVPFRVEFSKDTRSRGATFEITSRAFAQAFSKTVQPGDVDEPVTCEVRIDESLFSDGSTSDKKVPVLLVGTTDCTVGANDELELTVAPPIGVELAEQPFKPKSDTGYHRGETVAIRVRLTRDAPSGAQVTLECEAFIHPNLNPSGKVTIDVVPGVDTGHADVVLYAHDPSFLQGKTCSVELSDPKGCKLVKNGRLEVELEIKPPPVLDFDATPIEPAKARLMEAEEVTLNLVLSEPAPRTGIPFQIQSTAFEAPIVAKFLPGETKLTLKTIVARASTKVQAVTIVAEGDYPATLGPKSKQDLRVDPGAKAKFGTAWIEPDKPVYEVGDKITLEVVLDRDAPIDAFARVDSPAFEGRAYIARFPKGSREVGVREDVPEEDLAGKALKLAERLTPRALKMAPVLNRTYEVIAPPPKKLKAKIGNVMIPVGGTAPTPGSTITQEITVFGMRGCSGKETKRIQVRVSGEITEQKGVVSCNQNPTHFKVEPKYCNAHRLLITERHGGDRVVKRGHDGQGTWEVIPSHSAPALHLDAKPSPLTIQVTAGKVIYTKDDEPHKTVLLLRTSKDDVSCGYELQHPEATAGMRMGYDDDKLQMIKHPHLVVMQRQVKAFEAAVGNALSPKKAKALQDHMELRQMPEYPGWVSPVLSKKDEKKAKSKSYWDITDKASSGEVVRELGVKKRPQKYEKLAMKAAPLKVLDTGLGIIKVADIIRGVQTIFMPRLEHYRIYLETCGVPGPKGPKIPAPRLAAHIEVYPSEEFCFFANITPIPAYQWGNDGHYVVDGALASPGAKGVEGDPSDPNRPANQEQLGGDVLQPVTDQLDKLEQATTPPVGTSPLTSVSTTLDTYGGVQPLENQTATESKDPNSTSIHQRTDPLGGGVVQVPDESPPEVGTDFRKRGNQPLLQGNLRVFDNGQSYDRAKPSSSTEQRVLSGPPSTRVYHPVYSESDFTIPPEIAEMESWTQLPRIGLVVNGRPKPEFMKAMQALIVVLYAVRHIGEFFKAMQDMIPSWGWGVTFDVGLLEGGLRFRWGWKEYEDYRVFQWWQLEANLVLFRASIEVWVGVKWRALFVRFQFVAYVKISGMIPTKFSVERKGPDGGVIPNAEVSGVTQARAGLRIILIHENFLYADAAVKTGFQLKFTFKDPSEERLGIFWETYFLGLSIGVTFKLVGLMKIKQIEKSLIDGNPPGVPYREGVLCPRGHDNGNDAFRARRTLRHAFLRASAKFGQLDEVLSHYHDIQLDAAQRRDPAEWEQDADTDEKYDWPWTDDPGISCSPMGTKNQIKTDETTAWTGQWELFIKAMENGRVVVVGDTSGTGKVRKTASKRKAIPGVGKYIAKYAKKIALAPRLLDQIEYTAERMKAVKEAIHTIESDYLRVLREIDKEISDADAEDRPVRQEFLDQLAKADKWGDPFGKVTKIVDKATEKNGLDELEHYVSQVEAWRVGGQAPKP
ncbi:MAG: hypothetical protein U0414_28570 [Polyangiaceae bacterium]